MDTRPARLAKCQHFAKGLSHIPERSGTGRGCPGGRACATALRGAVAARAPGRTGGLLGKWTAAPEAMASGKPRWPGRQPPHSPAQQGDDPSPRRKPGPRLPRARPPALARKLPPTRVLPCRKGGCPVDTRPARLAICLQIAKGPSDFPKRLKHGPRLSPAGLARPVRRAHGRSRSPRPTAPEAMASGLIQRSSNAHHQTHRPPSGHLPSPCGGGVGGEG